MLFALRKFFAFKVETLAFAKIGRKKRKWDMYKKVYWFIGINIFESSITHYAVTKIDLIFYYYILYKKFIEPRKKYK